MGNTRRKRLEPLASSESPAITSGGSVADDDAVAARRVLERVSGSDPAEGSEYRQLYDLAPVIWMVLDRSGVIRDVNTACCHAVGAGAPFMIGTPLLIWSPQASGELIMEHMRRCRTTREPVETEVQLKSRRGQILTLRLHSRRSQISGRLVFPTVAIDITEKEGLDRALLAAERQRDLAEQERRAARAAESAKDRLIAMVSHELRNPLSPALIAASTLAALPDLPAIAKQMAAVIKRNIELEARLIDDLLDVARVTRGQLDLRRSEVDVHAVLERALETCAEAARAKDIRFDVQLAAGEHRASADEARLQQVFWNLLHNAVKFSHVGGRVQVRTSTEPDGVLRICVRDFGVGMDEETITRLFSPFEQPRIPTEGRAGLGLGLTIARSIVELHGGQIWARSDGPGTGTIFEVELATSVSGPVGEESAPASTTEASHARGRVLVVEDHVDTGMLLSRFLRQQGYSVRHARSLKEGLAALDEPWDAMLSDIDLGDGSGLDLARELRTRGQRLGRVVALSGFGTDNDQAASREAGFDTHLVKPVDLEQLLALLQSEG